MAANGKLRQLCESWWERLADGPASYQEQFAEMFMSLLGWKHPLRLPQLNDNGDTAVSFALPGDKEPLLAMHFVAPGSIDPPSNVLEHGLDFCPVTWMLCDTTHTLGIPYAFITDAFRSYLYDARSEELLVYADSPADLEKEFVDFFDASDVDQGALDELRRQPRSYVARQLREWAYRWSRTLVARHHAPEEAAHILMDRMLVLGFLMGHDILRRPGWSLGDRFAALVEKATGADPVGVGNRLVALFDEMGSKWGLGIFEPVQAVNAVLRKDAVAIDLIEEFALLSRSKFTLSTILESFNYGEAAEKARVRMIPEDNEERRGFLSKATVENIDKTQIELDLEDEGYRAVFYWFDRVVEVYQRLSAEFERGSRRRTGNEIDLFQWGEIDAARPDAVAEPLRHAVEKGLTVYYASERQYRTSRLLLYLHLIKRFEDAHVRVTSFPRVEIALKPRPRMTESDRRIIFNPKREDEWEVI